jgi:hypothetical protein
MISVLTGAVPKEAATISACDPNFSSKRQFLHVQYHASRRMQIVSHFAPKIKLLNVRGLCGSRNAGAFAEMQFFEN